MKNVILWLAALMLVLVIATFGGCTETPGATDDTGETPGTTDSLPEAPGESNGVTDIVKTTAAVADIAKHGNLILNITGAELFAVGYEYGDVLEVTIGGKSYALPLCSNYSDVDNGMGVLRAITAEDVLVIAYNMSDFATTEGIATKSQIDEAPGYRWDYLVQTPVQVEISMKQEGGYREQWLIRQLTGSADRADYPHLNDEDYANFRVIATTGMGKNILYRSSSPINPGIGRNTYADKAAKDAGIATIVNLADAENTYGSSEDAYYPSCQVVYLNLGMDFMSDATKASLANGIRFIINGEAPYLIHCNEGKDRAGFVSAILECLMGASLEEVIDDYMKTYYNYYGVEKGSEKYNAIVKNNLINNLKVNFKVGDVYTADLATEAEAYLTDELGLSSDEVDALKAKLRA